ADVEALQLARVALQRADGDAADRTRRGVGQQEHPRRRQVAGRQRGQLLVEALEVEGDAQRGRILGEQRSGRLDVGRVVRVEAANYCSHSTRPARTTAAMTGPPRW